MTGQSRTAQLPVHLRKRKNLRMIKDSCAEAVKRKGTGGCFFDAEHFFDGYKQDASYALACLDAAVAGGASWLVLCDTNGGTLPYEIERITSEVSERFDIASNESGDKGRRRGGTPSAFGNPSAQRHGQCDRQLVGCKCARVQIRCRGR